MKNSSSIVGESDHYNVFISFKGNNITEARRIREIMCKIPDFKVYLSDVDLDRRGRPGFMKEIEHAMANSDQLLIYLEKPQDLYEIWMEIEFGLFIDSQKKKRKKTEPIVIIRGFSKNDIPGIIKVISHAIDYDDINFENKLLNFCGPKKEEDLLVYDGTYIFLSTSNKRDKKFIDIPINLIIYWGLPRYSMIGIVLNYTIDVNKFEKFEKNIQNSTQCKPRKRKWVERNFKELKNYSINDFDIGENDLLGIIIQDILYEDEKSNNHIKSNIINFIEDISKKCIDHKPTIIVNLIGSYPVNDSGLINKININPATQGFSPDDYESYVGALSGRWECVVALREYFGGTMNAIDHINDNRDDYNGDFLAKIIELACSQTKDGNSFEHSFLANINDHSLLVALQCGYKFRTPFKELVSYLVRKGVSDGMLGLTVLCMEPEQIDFEVVASWDLNKRKFIGLLTEEEQANAGNVRQCFDQRNYFSSLYDDIIYH